jgi:hypothetical protein
MSKFQVLCSETVCYRVVVEADSAEEAEQMVADGLVDLGNPVDGDNFEIDKVELLGEANA